MNSNSLTRIFLLKKESEFSKDLIDVLSSNNYEVKQIIDFRSLSTSLELKSHDIYILDDLELLNRYYFSIQHFIVISYKTDIEHLSLAYSMGCSDYIRFPFDPKELLLRIKSLQRKISLMPVNDQIIQLSDGYSYNKQMYQLQKKDQIIPLTNKESSLLELFIQHRNKTLTSEQIKIYLWGDSTISSSAVRTLIQRLRKKFNDKDIITNKQAIGYTLTLALDKSGTKI